MSDETFQQGDPRPVFDGAGTSWNGATVAQREAHNARVRAWKKAQGIAPMQRTGGDAAKAQSQAGSGSGPPATPNAAHAAATRAVLVSIRDDAAAHDSDRIRAASALIALDREDAATQGDSPSPLSALRDTLALLAPEERLAWLQGERLAHHQAGTAEA